MLLPIAIDLMLNLKLVVAICYISIAIVISRRVDGRGQGGGGRLEKVRNENVSSGFCISFKSKHE